MRQKTTLSHAELRRQRLLQLARMKLIERRTDEECAQALKVSLRTVGYYKAGPAYAAVVQEAKREWKAGAEFQVHELARTALETMTDLMRPETKSEHVRFEAAKAIGDWLGLGVKDVEEDMDDRRELDRITKILEERRPMQVTIFQQQVQPGGFLPEGLQRAITAEDFLKSQVVEAET
jgi:hypothetical protein